MRNPTLALLALVALLAVATILPALTVSADPPGGAVMQFGRPGLGSGCNFPCDDDASFHAIDRIQPGAVNISEGDTVEFLVDGFHQVAIYEPGIKPKDIEADPASFPFVNDGAGRIALGGLSDLSFEFTDPGKYLVICNVEPHFEEAQMWGWVIVN